MTAAPDAPLISALPSGRLDGTRTSVYWKRPPGNFDRCNLRAVWPQVNEWGIPQIDPEPSVPGSLVPWHDPQAVAAAAGQDGAVHFFLDDYRFEQAWNRPEASIERLRPAGAALTPDFSLWRGMPLAVQVWQVYRSRWLGAWWQYHGFRVWPTASWAGPESYPFCFAGIPAGGVVAVSAVGVTDTEGRRKFAEGIAELAAQVNPSRLLCYGPVPDEAVAGIPVTVYPTFWQQRGRQRWEAGEAAARAAARAPEAAAR